VLHKLSGYTASIIAHGMVLGTLVFWKVTVPTPPELVLITSDVVETPEELNLVDALTAEDTTSNIVTTAAFAPGVPGTAGAARIEEARNDLKSQQVVAASMRADLDRPVLHGELKNFNLDSPIEGAVGPTMGNGGSDSSSVDRITHEIKNSLQKGRVLVCWVLDSTYSMRERREAVLKRFEKVYGELDRLGVAKEKALLTNVMMFGQRNQFLAKEPTADVQQLLKHLKEVKDDESGVENIFSAVRRICEEYRTYQVQQRRQLMIVVLTDEKGDDAVALDDAINICKRNRVPVYVMGPMAPFGRDKIMVDWTDKQTGEKFPVPTERGPESIEIEHLALPFWGVGNQFSLFGSGFGPYALTRLVRETGGLYFVDGSDFRGVRFNPDDMREYRPDYVPFKDYLESKRKSPLHAAVVEAAMQSQGKDAPIDPPMYFPVENMSPRLTDAQRIVAKTEFFVKQSLRSLQEVEKFREKETSKRWQAHFDLMLGRLLAARVRADEYNWALAQMKVNPKTPKEKGMNAFRLVGDKEISFGRKEIADAKKSETNVRKSDPKAMAKAKEDADKALMYLQRVIKDHPDTPWSKMAERELQTPLGFKWMETYIPPPPRPGQPLTPQQQAEQERQKKRNEAMKRVPKNI
jgi:hypothetical protein